MIIKNGLVFQEDGTFEKKDLYIENGKIVASKAEVSDTTEIDATATAPLVMTFVMLTRKD